ncbi:MAG: hypothetical protein ACPG79_07435 [Poseidonia sp.]
MTDEEHKQTPPQSILIQAGSASDPEPEDTIVPSQSPATLTEASPESTSAMQEAITHYNTVLTTKPDNTGLILGGTVFLFIIPVLVGFSAAESGDFDAAGVCCGSIIGGLVFFLLAIVRDSEWDKKNKLAKTQIINLAGLKTPPVSKTPIVAAGVFGVAWFISANLPFYYRDVMTLVTFLLFAGAALVGSVNSLNADKTLKRNFKMVLQQHEVKKHEEDSEGTSF